MRSKPSLSAVALVCAAVSITSRGARADYASAPFTGATIVTNPKFTNIYLYPDPNKETWDQHLASLHRAAANDPFLSETSEAIDAFVLTLSGGSYFNALAQYRTWSGVGISTPVFAGGEKTSQKCVDAALKDAKSGMVLEYGTLRSFANCQQSVGGNPSPQVNIIVSPELNVAGWGSGALCASGGTISGYHGFGFNVPNFTVIPTNTLCNATFDSLTQTISHEMVETVSDPSGFGYIHENSFGRFFGDDTAEFNQGELGDICESGPQNPAGDPAIALTTIAGFSVSRYWSNFDGDCEPQSSGNAAWVDRIWFNNAGTPLFQLTGDAHNWQGNLTVAGADRGQVIEQLVITIQTGDDDLRGGGGANDNADVILKRGDGTSFTIQNINGGRHWNNGETHSATLPLPVGTNAGDLASFTIHTQFGGGLGGDNWKVNRVTVVASLPNAQFRCAPWYGWNGAKCVQCGIGWFTVYDATHPQGACQLMMKCDASGKNCVSRCGANSGWDYTIGKCLPCPCGELWDWHRESCQPSGCGARWHWDCTKKSPTSPNGECVANLCTAVQGWNSATNTCVSCPQNYAWSQSASQCVKHTCLYGATWNESKKTCECHVPGKKLIEDACITPPTPGGKH